MRTLLTLVLLGSMAFAQSAPATEKPRDEAKSGCCGDNRACCGEKKDGNTEKKGDCCGESEGMCHRPELKDEKAAEKRK